MKITKDGVYHTIVTDPLYCNWIFDDYRITPQSYAFKIVAKTENAQYKPCLTQGQDIVIWFYNLLSGKLLTTPNNNTPEFLQFCENITHTTNSVLFVKELNGGYILETIFTILSQIADEHTEIISIELI